MSRQCQLALLFVVTMGLVACSQEQGAAPDADRGVASAQAGALVPAGGDVPAKTDVATPDAPREGELLRFSETEHDLGVVPDDKGKVRHVFTFRNVSEKPVTIRDIVCKCGCTVAEGRGEVAPGEEGTVVITYDPHHRQGKDRRVCELHLVVDGVEHVMELALVADVDARIAVEPRAVWMGEFDEGGPGQTFEVEITTQSPGFELLETKSYADRDLREDDPRFTVKVTSRETVTVRGTERQQLKLAVAFAGGEAVGRIDSRLVLKTNDEDKPQIVIPFVGSVFGTLRVAPDLLMLVLDSGTHFSRNLRISPKDGTKAFEIKALRIEGAPEGIDLSVTEMDANPQMPVERLINVSGTAPEIGVTQGGQIDAEVVIETDLADQPVVRVPFKMYVRSTQPVQGQVASPAQHR